MNSNKTPQYSRVLLGEVGPAHGIRGDVVVRTYTGSPEDIASYGPLEDESGQLKLTLRPVRVTPKGLIARIDGAGDRSAAEKLRGTKLYVARDRLPQTGDGEFYVNDLAGLAVVDPAGITVGSVAAVHNFGAGDILEVRFDSTNRTEMFGFTNANFPQVDLAARTIVFVAPPATGEAETG